MLSRLPPTSFATILFFLSPRASTHKKRAPHRFITDVILPALFSRKRGTRQQLPPIFPKLKAGKICITWIGHASFLIQGPHGNILVDPNWANWLLVVRRLRHAGLAHHHLPSIDLVSSLMPILIISTDAASAGLPPINPLSCPLELATLCTA